MSEGDQSQGILAPHPGGATPISRRIRYQLGNPRGWRNAKAAGEDGAVCSGNGLCRGRYSSSQWPLLMENQGRLGSSNLKLTPVGRNVEELIGFWWYCQVNISVSGW